MIVLGLTGSIGMGKSTLAGMMKNLRIPVHDSDIAVHKLLGSDPVTHAAVADAFPYFEFPQIYDKKTKIIKRKELGTLIFADDEKRIRLENILHPLVRQSQEEFLRNCKIKNKPIACLDIPLLFETGAEKRVDYTLVITAPFFVQKARVMARPNMTEEKFQAILARQMPDAEKKQRADYIIPTGLGLAHTLKMLKAALQNIQEKEFPKKVTKKVYVHDP